MLSGSLKLCTAVEHPTVQTPPQHMVKDTHSDASPQQSTQEEDPPATTDDSLLTGRPTDTLRTQEITRLPKLTFPLFSGNVLEWQSFWYCFETTVHNNPTLSGVQKLNYLCAQLQEGVLHVITGLPLTNTSYSHSVTLLCDRYG